MKSSIQGKLSVMLVSAGLLLSGAALAHNHGSADKDYDEKRVKLDIEEWDVPYEGPRSRDPWVGGEDLVWFVGQRTHYVGALEPSSGDFKKFDLDDGAGPHTVISNGSDVWYAGNRMAHLGHIDANTGEITKFAPPGEGRRDVHTMDFDSQGNIWFTEQGGNRIGYFDVETHEFTMYEVPTERSRPYAVAMDSEGRFWFVETGVQPNLFVAFDPQTESFTDSFEVPSGGGTVRHMVYDDATNTIWFGTDMNTIGRAVIR